MLGAFNVDPIELNEVSVFAVSTLRVAGDGFHAYGVRFATCVPFYFAVAVALFCFTLAATSSTRSRASARAPRRLSRRRPRGHRRL